MTTAWLPAQLLYVAAQFASTDPVKQALTAIRVRPAKETGIIIDSCDGHRAFRVVCPDPTWECSEPILIAAKPLKKRLPTARIAAIDSDTVPGAVRLTGGRGAIAEHLCDIPCQAKHYETNDLLPPRSFPHLDQLWPESFTNAPSNPIGFNAALLLDFLAEVKRYTYNSVVTMRCNTPTNPMVFNAIIDDKAQKLDDVTMEFLLMPVQIRA
jgi:hypothetical protein